MTTLAALTTPCLLLEDEKLQANMDRLARRLHERGVSLRPHLKTCKNKEIARRCMESPTGPATVSTLAEAEYFAAGGVRDICYAVGIAPNKLERVAGLRRRGIDLSVVLDNEESARLLVDAEKKYESLFNSRDSMFGYSYIADVVQLCKIWKYMGIWSTLSANGGRSTLI